MLWYETCSHIFGCHLTNLLLGRIYCHSCSSKYIQLPEKMNVYQGYSSVYNKAKSWVYWNQEAPKTASEPQRVCFTSIYSLYLPRTTSIQVYFSSILFHLPYCYSKVCESCYDAVAEQEELWIYIQAFQVIALELPLLKRAATGIFLLHCYFWFSSPLLYYVLLTCN